LKYCALALALITFYSSRIIDDGCGFTNDAFQKIAILGGGDKQDIPFSKGKRHYLASYGMGLNSTLNIASKIQVQSFSDEGAFSVELDWSKLEVAAFACFNSFSINYQPRMLSGSTNDYPPHRQLDS
jgi:hypothetical protein